MKKSKITGVILLTATLGMLTVFSSCKSKEKLTKVPGEELNPGICSGPEYFTNSEYFRANQVGESLDQATAKKKAMSNARAELASSIGVTVKLVVDDYLKSRELNNNEEVMERYEALSREVVYQRLTGIRTICEKTTKTTEGKYKTYVAIELAGDDLMNSLNASLSNDAMIKIDYEYEKFRETFNVEMKKLKSESTY